MRGTPLRLEISPKDIEKDQAVLVRRDNAQKIFVPLDGLENAVTDLLQSIHHDMFLAAKKLLDEKTYVATDYDDFKRIMAEIPGLIKAMWRGDESCEDVIKEQTSATSRCAPFQQERLSDVCVCGGGKAKKMIVWSKAY